MKRMESMDSPHMFMMSLHLKYTVLLKEIALAQAKAGDFPRAIETAGKIPSGDDQWSGKVGVETMGEIAVLRAKAGDFAGALKTVRDHPGEHWHDPLGNFPVVCEIARLQARAGDARGAVGWAVGERSPKARLAVLRSMAEGVAETRAPAKPASP
jgi:hypothetical protein